MRVSDLTRQKPVSVKFEDDGDTIDLVFDRNKVTPAWVTLAQERDNAEDTLSLPKALADVILSWDVVNDDGSPFELTPENIAVLSFPTQSALLRKIMEAAVPSRAEGNASANTSATAEQGSTSLPASLPNGLPPSPSQNPSAAPSQT